MTKKFKRRVSLLLTIIMMTTLAFQPVQADPPEKDVKVAITMDEAEEHEGKQIYKLIYSIISPHGLSAISTVMSYDKGVIVPVDEEDFTDAGVASGEDFYAPFKVLIKGTNKQYYSVSGAKAYAASARNAFIFDIYSASPVVSINQYTDMFEFYFRLADGKTEEDLNSATFRVETDKREGSFLAMINTTPESLETSSGIVVGDKYPGGDRKYYYPFNIELELSYTNDNVATPLGSPTVLLSAIEGGGIEATISDSVNQGEARDAIEKYVVILDGKSYEVDPGTKTVIIPGEDITGGQKYKATAYAVAALSSGYGDSPVGDESNEVEAPYMTLAVTVENSIDDFKVGQPISKEVTEYLKVSGGSGVYTYEGAGLPPGVSLSSAGLLTGTPVEVAVAGTATITVNSTDGQSVSVSIPYGKTVAGDAILSLNETEISKTYKDSDFSLVSLLTYSVSGKTPGYAYELKTGDSVEVDNEGMVSIKKIGTSTIEITASLVNYNDAKATLTINVTPKNIVETDFEFTLDGFTYTGAEIEPSVTSDSLSSDDYWVEYENNKNAGTGKITVRGKGNYNGQIIKYFTIEKANAGISMDDTVTLYLNGVTKILSPSYTVEGIVPNYSFSSGDDNVVKVDNQGRLEAVSTGSAQVTITAVDPGGNYNDAVKVVDVTVKNKENVSASITFEAIIGSIDYDGNSRDIKDVFNQAVFTGTGDGTATMLYRYGENNYNSLADIGATIKDGGSYEVIAIYEDDSQYGEKTAIFEIKKAKITITPLEKEKIYGEQDPVFTYVIEGKPENGVDILGVLERDTGENKGKYEILRGTITEATNPNYEITFVEGKYLTIKAKVLSAGDLEYQGDSIKKTYDGTTSVSLPDNGRIVVKDEALVWGDQSPTLEYSGLTYDSKDVTATKVTFAMKSFSANYEIEADLLIEAAATIEPRALTDVAITLIDEQKPYDGETHHAAISSIKFGGEDLVEGEDKDYIILSNPSITDVGTTFLKIEGKNNYCEIREIPFKIVKANSSISIISVNGALDKDYDGQKAHDPNYTAQFNGDVSFVHYKDDQGTIELTAPPVDSGTYHVKAVLAETDNYNESESTLFKYIISPLALGNVEIRFPTGFTATKVYDGTDALSTLSHDVLIVETGVNGEQVGIDLPGTGKYSSINVGGNLTVNLNLGTTLNSLENQSGKASNYTIGEEFPKTIDYSLASITPAPYNLTVSSSVSMKKGSGLSDLPPAVTQGVNGEVPAGDLVWYKDADRTHLLKDDDLKQYDLGDYVGYWKFTVSDDNYETSLKTGATNIKIVEGDPQNITITGIPASNPSYGDSGFQLTATVTTTGGAAVSNGGMLTWSSSDTSVATIDGEGNVTIVGSGETTIEVKAAAVPGEYAQGSESFILEVNPKILAVNGDGYNVSKTYDGSNTPGEGRGTLQLTGKVNDDDVEVTAVIPAYGNKNVGGQSKITISLSLTGAKAGNYTLESGSLEVDCEIFRRNISEVTIQKVEKTYDGTTEKGDSSIEGLALTGKIEGDDLNIDVTGYSYDNKNVNEVQKVNLTFGSLTGLDAPNYIFNASNSLEAEAKINPATITGVVTSPIVKTMLANHADNSNAESLKGSSVLDLPPTVEVSYSPNGTESLTITWNDAMEDFNIKGEKYTYKGAVNNGSNFKAYAETFDAELTVTPVKITGIEGVPGALTVAKATVMGADSLTDLGLPSTVTLKHDNEVADGSLTCQWDTTVASLKNLAQQVSDNVEKKATVSLRNAGFPEWATLDSILPSTELTITNKFVIPSEDISFAAEDITYGESVSSAATVNGDNYPGYEVTYEYVGTGSTSYGPSSTPPENAGTYRVIATVETLTHKGSKSVNLTIRKKVLSTVSISSIGEQTYTGSAIEPAYTVTGDSILLVANEDYHGSFSSNTGAGIATLTVECKGNYEGTASTTFIIAKATPYLSFTNTNQTLTSAGGNITDVVATLNPGSADATVTVFYRVLLSPGSPCNVEHDADCASIVSGDIADCSCTKNHKSHDENCGYAAAVYQWTTTVPQVAGSYKIYGRTEGDSNLNPVNLDPPSPDSVDDKLIINPYQQSGGGAAGGGEPPSKDDPVTTIGDTSSIKVGVSVTTKGTTASAKIDSVEMNKAIDEVMKAASENNTNANVVLEVKTEDDVKKIELGIPADSLRRITEKSETATMTITTSVGTIVFDRTALAAIGESAAGRDIVIVAEDMEETSMNKQEQALVGSVHVVDVYVISGGIRIADFKGGTATVTIPYILKEGEDAKGIVVWYLSEEGKLEKKSSMYDEENSRATFVANHFSKYVVAYFPFTDLFSGEWYYENTVYAYLNGLMNGVGDGRFAPLEETTRAMVVTILWRQEGMPGAGANGFKDVQGNTWYSDAISWASEKGIVSGYSKDKFGPMDRITREQMAVIINNYAAFKGYDMKGKADLAQFKDQANVSGWAEEAVRWAVENGIIGGIDSDKLSPKGSAKRAQVAAILQRMMTGGQVL